VTLGRCFDGTYAEIGRNQAGAPAEFDLGVASLTFDPAVLLG
jgi:hypothetical protein